jgi:hypothetical protein
MSSQEFIKSHYLSLYECFVANVQESLLDVLDQNVDMTKEQKEKTIKMFKPQLVSNFNSYNQSKRIIDKKLRDHMESDIDLELAKLSYSSLKNYDNIFDLLERAKHTEHSSDDSECDNSNNECYPDSLGVLNLYNGCHNNDSDNYNGNNDSDNGEYNGEDIGDANCEDNGDNESLDGDDGQLLRKLNNSSNYSMAPENTSQRHESEDINFSSFLQKFSLGNSLISNGQPNNSDNDTDEDNSDSNQEAELLQVMNLKEIKDIAQSKGIPFKYKNNKSKSKQALINEIISK